VFPAESCYYSGRNSVGALPGPNQPRKELAMAEQPDIIDGEEWRPVAAWEDLYEVSSLGRVRSLPRSRARTNRGIQQVVHYKGRLLSLSLRNGYPFVGLRDGLRYVKAYVHQLVCEAWHGPRPQGFDVAHADGGRIVNTPQNLRWASRLENMRDKSLHGTERTRDNYLHAKISSSNLADIRAKYAAGARPRDIFREYGVTRGYASYLRTKLLSEGCSHGR
jgi:hypothetical protein